MKKQLGFLKNIAKVIGILVLFTGIALLIEQYFVADALVPAIMALAVFVISYVTDGFLYGIIASMLSVILTGFNIYPSIANWGGAGALVPITGFANGVAAPAIEFQKEGQVFGIGCKIFTIAGPVILYGVFSSWVLGLIYWSLGLLGIQ